MYLGVDVGGSKTLVAIFDGHGTLKQSQKFPTPKEYEDFLKELEKTVVTLSTEEFQAAGVAIPGVIDREEGAGLRFGNLPWKNVPVQADCERLFHCPVVVENDAKAAGLSEAKLIKKDFKRVLYMTVSTGIGYALIVNGVLDVSLGDHGGHSMMFEHNGSFVSWESFASGQAIVARYGKRASELDDPKAWEEISRNLTVGMIDLIAKLQPEVIVIGGGVGAHFKRFASPLKKILKTYETPLMHIPALVQAKHAEEAVIYGCYELIKGRHGHVATKA